MISVAILLSEPLLVLLLLLLLLLSMLLALPPSWLAVSVERHDYY